MHFSLSYDTIKLIHPTPDAQLIVESVGRRFPEMQKRNTFRTMYKNMEVGFSWQGLHVNNSFTTLHKGSNLRSLSLTELSDAITRLSRVLSKDIADPIDLRDARVTRVDIAGNIELHESPVSKYLYTLGTMTGKGFNQQRINDETLKYHLLSNTKSKGESFQLEDKIAEMKKNNPDKIPTGYSEKSIIRLESQLIGKQRLCDVNGGNVFVPTLTDERFYKAMCERWYKRFTSIQPVRNIVLMNAEYKTRDALLMELGAVGLAHVAPSFLKRAIKGMKSKSEREKAEYLVSVALKNRSHVSASECYDELRSKVERLFTDAVGTG